MTRGKLLTSVWVAVIAAGIVVIAVSVASGRRTKRPAIAPRPSTTPAAEAVKTPARTEKATFGAGCFWGVEEAFRKLPGVIDTKVGFMGGSAASPSYSQVCGGGTGHAEVCQVTFDPAKTSYARLLETFWRIHDPRRVTRPGYQYRSAVFYRSAEQKAAAEAAKVGLAKSGKPIATSLEKAGEFWPAQEYHQRFYQKRGGGTCE